MLRLQHHPVAAKGDDDLRLVERRRAMAFREPVERRARDLGRRGEEGDAGGGHGEEAISPLPPQGEHDERCHAPPQP